MPPPGSIPRHPGAGSLPRCCASQGRGPGRAPAGLGAPLGALAAPRPRGAACELLEGRWLRAAPLTSYPIILLKRPPQGSCHSNAVCALWGPPARGSGERFGTCRDASIRGSLPRQGRGWREVPVSIPLSVPSESPSRAG